MKKNWQAAYATLREREQLGYYNFRSEPVVHPEYHRHFEDQRLNELHLLATAEHERIHDMLARQTTHGFVLLLLNRRLQKADDEEAFTLLDVLDRVHAAGRDAHEMYALYGTLKSSKPYEVLLPTLPPDYQHWLDRAESSIPSSLRGKRLGRVVVYASILYALSPELPAFDPNAPTVTQLCAAGERVGAVNDRLQRATEQFLSAPLSERIDIVALARSIGYYPSELALPVFFEDANLLVFRPGEEPFETRETRLVWRLLKVLSERLSAYPAGVGGPELKTNITPYCQAIAPELRLRSQLLDAWNISEAEHGRLNQLLQENIHSALFNFPVKYARSLARSETGFNRVLQTVREQGHRMLLGGYLNNRMSDELAGKFRPHATFQSKRHIRWYCINPDLAAYRQGDQVYILYTLDHLDHTKLEVPETFPAVVLIAAYDYYDNPELMTLYRPLEQKGIPLLIFQAINLLDLIEWHLERDLPHDALRIELTRVPDELFALSRVYFPDNPYPFVRLIGPSTRVGMADLATSGYLEIDFLEKDHFTPEDQVVVAFLRMLWRE